MSKEALSVVAIALTVLAFGPYIWSVYRGNTKAHVFSWIIWCTSTIIVFSAQTADEGGAGAWPIGLTSVACLTIAVIAYFKKADRSITAIDWVFFLLALASVPIWFVTSAPLWTVIMLTVMDLLGFGPTFRKAYHKPHEEHLRFFAIMTVRNSIAISALENYTVTTVLFPAAVAVTTSSLIVMVLLRRRAVGRSGG